MTYEIPRDVALSSPLSPRFLLFSPLFIHSNHTALLLILNHTRYISKLGLLLWLMSVPGIFFPQVTSSSPASFRSDLTFTTRPTNLKRQTAHLWISSFFLLCSTFSF